MRTFAFLALLAASVAGADVLLKNAGVNVGPVTSLNCYADGGLYCARDAGSVGTIRCNEATATEPGCVTPQAQSWGGTKTISSGDFRIVGHVHASLTACAAGTKGTWQTCTTHNSPVFCDGTNNYELLNSSAPERLLLSVYINGVPIAIYGGTALSSTSGATVTSIKGTWAAGSGGGNLTMRISDGSNNCDCAVSCASPTVSTACSGNCTFAASASLTVSRNATACTLNPVLFGNMQVMGTQP